MCFPNVVNSCGSLIFEIICEVSERKIRDRPTFSILLAILRIIKFGLSRSFCVERLEYFDDFAPCEDYYLLIKFNSVSNDCHEMASAYNTEKI